MLYKEESWRQVLSSLVVCFFSRGIYKPDLVSRALEVTGYNFGADHLQTLGEEILRSKNMFKFREGFDMDNMRLPKRIFKIPTPLGLINEGKLGKLSVFSKNCCLKNN